MIQAFLSEWVKMLRLRQVLAVWGVMAALLVLFSLLILGNAGTEADREEAAARVAAGERGAGPVVLISQLEQPSGLTFGLQVGGNILGIVSLVLFAGNLAGEYSNGTLKVLLSRKPQRLRLLLGKIAALFTFAIAGITLAAVAQVLAAASVALARGFHTDAWWTGAALYDAAGLVARLWISTLAWGSIGVLLAILLRSGPGAIGLGIGYVLVGEGLLSLALPNLVRYLPGQVTNAFVNAGAQTFGSAGTDSVTYATAALLMVGYVALFLSVSSVVFVRRDVTG